MPAAPARVTLDIAPSPRPKLVIAMVGLPARGKSYISRKLARYLSWRGHTTRVFNAGDYRRRTYGACQPHAFFDPDNLEGRQARDQVALEALADLLDWLARGGEIGIYDATNSTRERRTLVTARCNAAGVEVIFVESYCTDESIIDANIQETKLRSPDYLGQDPVAAVADFRARIAHYERVYEPLEDPSVRYVRIVDVGRQVVANRINGFVPARIVYFLMNIHPTPRPIWLTRHGRSEDNLAGRIGGDSMLSESGRAYAAALARFLHGRYPDRIEVLTSTLRRAVETAQSLEMPYRSWKELDEIDAGVCDGMTYAEIERELPLEFEARRQDKLRYRYPQGESYQDVIRRADHIIIELERRRTPVLVVAHQAVLRVLYAYFMGHHREECPHLEMPLHTLIQLCPLPSAEFEERRFPLT